MSKHLVDSPQFIESFVETCFSAGCSEKQASVFLNTFIKGELFVNDVNFRLGVTQAFEKAAFMRAAKGVVAPILGAAGLGAAASAATDPGILPPDARSGAITGAGLGAGLGALALAIKNPRQALRMLKSPLKAGIPRMFGALKSPTLWKSTLGLGVGGAAAGGVQSLKTQAQYPMLNPNTGVPWYMGNQAPSATPLTSSPAAPGNPFELPTEISSRIDAANPQKPNVADIQSNAALVQGKNQLKVIDGEISQIEAALPNGLTPANYGQRKEMQTQLDMLKKNRAAAVARIGALTKALEDYNADAQRATGTASSIISPEQRIRDKADMTTLAAERYQQANRGFTSAQNEFSNLRNRVDAAAQPGLTGWLLQKYNNLTGVDERMRQLDPIYRSYEQQMAEARRIQEMAAKN